MILPDEMSQEAQNRAVDLDETKQPQLWHRIALGVILLVSAFLNVFQLNQEGYANLYYAATVKSMLANFHNYFFVSFDPGGFVSVDKPPVGFWIQAASAKIFGFSGLSILLPEAMAGVLSVALLYYLVRRRFGPVAGLIAALALAISPISVVTNRNNTIDSLLVLTLLLAARTVSLARSLRLASPRRRNASTTSNRLRSRREPMDPPMRWGTEGRGDPLQSVTVCQEAGLIRANAPVD